MGRLTYRKAAPIARWEVEGGYEGEVRPLTERGGERRYVVWARWPGKVEPLVSEAGGLLAAATVALGIFGTQIHAHITRGCGRGIKQ